MSPARRRRFVQVGFLAVVVSGVEAVAALAVALLLGLVLNPGELPEFPVVGDVTRFFPDSSYENLVFMACGVFAVLFLARAGLFLFQQYAVAKVTENTAVVLGDRLVNGYLSMPYEWHLQRNSSELVRNSWNNVNEVATSVVQRMAFLVADSVLALAMLSVLFVTSATLTLAAGATLGLSLLATLVFVQPRLKRYGKVRQTAARAGLQALQQAFGGIRDVKVLGVEAPFAESFRRSRSRMGRVRYKYAALSYVPSVAIEMSFLALLLVGVAFAVANDEIDTVLSTLGVFAYAGLRLQPSLQKIAMSLNSLRFASAAVEEIHEGLDMLDSSVAARDAYRRTVHRRSLDEVLRLEDVSYTYPGSAEPALASIDLSIRAGSSIGVVGTTGGGKSTLLDVLCALVPPTAGTVTVDGVDVAAEPRAWQRSLGVVHQASFLIDDTVRRNIALGVRDRDVDDAEVARAATLAQLDAVIHQLPAGLDTTVGERGSRLSGGQQQRVAVARALYRRPSVLILDEGTASLDNETERAMVTALRAIPELTLVMVAHRLTTVQDCDQIVLLDEGRLAAVGTYEQLLEESRQFRELARPDTEE